MSAKEGHHRTDINLVKHQGSEESPKGRQVGEPPEFGLPPDLQEVPRPRCDGNREVSIL